LSNILDTLLIYVDPRRLRGVARRKSVLTDPTVDLTPKQTAYVELRAMGADQQNAVKTAYGPGMNTTDAKELEALPKITQALVNERAKNAFMLGLTRDKVLQGIVDAIDQAKLLADPMAQIAGWREAAKICGFYAPEVKKVELTGTAKRVVDRLQSLSDQELMEIAMAEDIEYVERAQ
jgi:hypothetical protein